MDKDNLALLILLQMSEDLTDVIHSSEMDYSDITDVRKLQEFQTFREIVRQTRTAMSE